MRTSWMYCVILSVAAASALGARCAAQEVGFVDLTKVTAHRGLRRPSPTRGANEARSGVQEVRPCFDSVNSESELRTTLVSLDRTHYQVGDEPTFEVTVENVSSAPLRIPFSRHLADLQPENPAQKFARSELQLVLWIAAGTEWSANTGGGVTLYGAEDHPNTMLTLSPGEWVRIIGKGKFILPAEGVSAELIPSGHPIDHVYAQVSLYRVETLLTPTAAATLSREACLRQTQGGSVPIALAIASPRQ